MHKIAKTEVSLLTPAILARPGWQTQVTGEGWLDIGNPWFVLYNPFLLTKSLRNVFQLPCYYDFCDLTYIYIYVSFFTVINIFSFYLYMCLHLFIVRHTIKWTMQHSFSPICPTACLSRYHCIHSKFYTIFYIIQNRTCYVSGH